MVTEWELRNLHVDDNRLEELREAYEHLALHPSDSSRVNDRAQSDAEHASILTELQEHREHLCRECEGRTYVPNPEAEWSRDSDGVDYCNGPEEIECPHCDGVGYEKPTPPKVVAFSPAPLDEETPF